MKTKEEILKRAYSLIEKEQSIGVEVDKILLEALKEYAKEKAEQAISDTFNQVHYSYVHPDQFKVMSYEAWSEKWMKENF